MVRSERHPAWLVNGLVTGFGGGQDGGHGNPLLTRAHLFLLFICLTSIRSGGLVWCDLKGIGHPEMKMLSLFTYVLQTRVTIFHLWSIKTDVRQNVQAALFHQIKA